MSEDLENNDNHNKQNKINNNSKTKIYQDIEFSSQINFDSKLDDYQYHSIEKNHLISTNDSTPSSANQKQTQRYRRHFGNNCVLFFRKGEPLITIGPHWPMFLCVEVCFLVAGISMAQFLAITISKTYFFLTLFVTFLQVFCYGLVALANPGICSTNSQLPEEEFLPKHYCKPCRVIMTKDTYHCLDCDICVRGYDHHCPWVGKCVGEGNLAYFYIFLCTTFGFLMYCIFIGLRSV